MNNLGWVLVMPFQHILLNEQIFPKNNEFIPDRFAKEGHGVLENITFGAGKYVVFIHSISQNK
jgi:cytochrome P450